MLALKPLPQDSAGIGIGLNLPGVGMDEEDWRLATASPFTVARIETAPEPNAVLVPAVALPTDVSGLPEKKPGQRAAQVGGGGRDTYFARLRVHLAGYRRDVLAGSDRTARAVVAFTVSPVGEIAGLELVQASGFPELDVEALELVARAVPLPPPPGGRAVRLSVPVFIEP
ncbi:MAG: TonB family protein [Panacagrimonas sp.]